MSSSNCCFLTCIQVSQETGLVICYSHLFQNFPQLIVIHTVKGFGIVNKAEIDVFLELFCFFDDPVDIGNLTSGSSAFSKTSLNIWKFKVHMLLKPGLKNFKYDFTSVWDECNCTVVGTFFAIALLWDWCGCPLFLFLSGLPWLEPPIHCYLFPDLSGKTFSLTVTCDVGFLEMPFVRLIKFPFIPVVLNILSNGLGFCQIIFFCIYWDNYVFCPYWYNVLYSSKILNQHCVSRISFSCLWCVIILIYIYF